MRRYDLPYELAHVGAQVVVAEVDDVERGVLRDRRADDGHGREAERAVIQAELFQ